MAISEIMYLSHMAILQIRIEEMGLEVGKKKVQVPETTVKKESFYKHNLTINKWYEIPTMIFF